MSHHGRIAASELRDAPRKHVLMHAVVISGEGPQRVHVKDLALTGARILTERRLEEGWDVIFKRGDDFRAARVAWARKDEAGLQFYREA